MNTINAEEILIPLIKCRCRSFSRIFPAQTQSPIQTRSHLATIYLLPLRVCHPAATIFVMLLFIVMNERVRRDNTQSVQTTVLYYGQWLPFSTKDCVIDTTSRSRSTILSIHINTDRSTMSENSGHRTPCPSSA